MTAGSGSDTRSGAARRSPGAAQLAPVNAPASRAAAALIAVGWCGALSWLVLTTSNPVTLNRRQILDADAVVTAHVTDLKSGRCRVVKQWTGDPLTDEIVVERLNQTAALADGEWILPLARHSDELQVVASRLPSRARLVYPATPEAVAQLEAILGK